MEPIEMYKIYLNDQITREHMMYSLIHWIETHSASEVAEKIESLLHKTSLV